MLIVSPTSDTASFSVAALPAILFGDWLRRSLAITHAATAFTAAQATHVNHP
jgi:hypothetical protein